MVLACKPDGTWGICFDYRSLNAITCLAIEPLLHIDALLAGTGRVEFLHQAAELDLASSYHQLRVLPADRWKMSLLSHLQLGQFEWESVGCRALLPAGGLITADSRDESGTHCGAGLSRKSEHGSLPPNAPTGPHLAS